MTLKAIIQTFSKVDKSNRGFTLIELIVGLSIMLIVSGLAMNAFIQASTTFNKDKRSIDASQNMSVVLEMIGNDIKQSGENIGDGNFPTIEFKIADPVDPADANLMFGSSKITVRRALIGALTLCEKIDIGRDFPPNTPITVYDNAPATVANSSNCDAATNSNPLIVSRETKDEPKATPVKTGKKAQTYYPGSPPIPPATTSPAPPTPRLTPSFPLSLRQLRDYRCKLDNLNPAIEYDVDDSKTTDYCGGANANLEKTRIAVSNLNGQFLIFNQTDEVADTGNTADDIAPPIKKYQITVNNTFPTNDPAIAINNKNKAVEYNIGSPIYVLEERVYTLRNDGVLQLSIDGKAPETLIKKIDNFRVSARIYTDTLPQPKEDRIVDFAPANNVCPDTAPFAPQPAAGSPDSPKYICQFNYFNSIASADWKTLAGIKVEVQAKYDGTGQNAIATDNDKKKLYSASEFFPRNVLSR